MHPSGAVIWVNLPSPVADAIGRMTSGGTSAPAVGLSRGAGAPRRGPHVGLMPHETKSLTRSSYDRGDQVRCRTASWCRNARFSSTRARRVLRTRRRPVRMRGIMPAIIDQAGRKSTLTKDISGIAQCVAHISSLTKAPESQIQRAAAVPLSSGRVLKAMAVCGAARWMALTTASNSTSRLGGRRTPAPTTTQS
jgi:hypothetical protein